MKTNQQAEPKQNKGNAQNDDAQPTRQNTNLSGDTPEEDPELERNEREPGKQEQRTDMPEEEKDII